MSREKKTPVPKHSDSAEHNMALDDLLARATKIDITEDPDQLLAALVTAAGDLLDFDRLTISLPSNRVPDGLRITLVAGRQDEFAQGREYSANGMWHGEVYLRAQGLIIGNAETGYQGRFEAGDLGHGWVKSFMGVPIIEAGEPQGTVSLESAGRQHYGPDDLKRLTAIAGVFGTAYWWARRYQQEHANAMMDGLTQMLNHRSFMQRLEEELERNTRYGDSMTLLMLDLDNFKQTNDKYGHLHGDFVLSRTAQLIRSSIRMTDVPGRLGGEEFGVIIINASKRITRSTAQRIRSSIAEHKFINDGLESRMAISIGMAEYPTDGHNIKELLRKSDEAMYSVKASGGNGVISYSRQLEKQKEGKHG
ncbi:MAG: sensor domain-containing diguanylate cyclase [Candidatus Marinimicrobia bacterium]|nr:sensor domain-containing diguanylate cyclase [Candidatus Neomarinimicrobiota bacterium]